ncbi:MAG: type II toxin-antitoxin system HicB family antitoxin [Phycisphaerales bacterium]|nr:type II toxin-antitoxin system HicB family antitoxin [Phycisphaerales bacterium]
MNYPVVIHKDRNSDYGVIVPDLPGCFTFGRTIDEALAMAKEAIELHIQGLVEEALTLPPPGKVERYRRDPQFESGTWAMVHIDARRLRRRAKRINITMQERLLDKVDRAAGEQGETRSGFLEKAVLAYMPHAANAAAHPSLGGKRVQPGRAIAQRR